MGCVGNEANPQKGRLVLGSAEEIGQMLLGEERGVGGDSMGQ